MSLLTSTCGTCKRTSAYASTYNCMATFLQIYVCNGSINVCIRVIMLPCEKALKFCLDKYCRGKSFGSSYSRK